MRHGLRAAVLVVCLAVGSPACAGSSDDLTGPSPTIGTGARVLFIGNSLTQGNDVPGMVRTLAAAAGLGWYVDAELSGGASLQDHWERGLVQAKVRNGNWDAVVLQQGPSSLYPRAGRP